MKRVLSLAAVALLAPACTLFVDDHRGEPCDPTAHETICTIAGTGEQELGADHEPAMQTALYVPIDTAVSPDGELWVLDFNNYVIRAIDAAGEMRIVAGTGAIGDSPPTGVPSVPALDADINHTSGLLFDDGYLYLAAWHNSRVKRVNLATMELENYAGAGKRMHYDGDGSDALAAAVDLPSALAVDPTGNIVFMDQANQVIRMVDANHVIHRVAGQCVIEEQTTCAPGQQPVQCPSSNKTTCGNPATDCDYGFCSPAFAGDGGTALDLRMGQPYGAQATPSGGLAYDRAGRLYFADTDNNRIRRIDANGIVTTVAGTGIAGFSGEGVRAIEATLDHPVDVIAADDGSLYFSDVENNCVRRIDPAGVIHTVVGQCSSDPADRGFAGDGGPPLEAKLDRPYGIELVGKTLYVADSYNNRVRRVNL